MPADSQVILLLTRPAEAARRFAEELRAAGAGPFRTVISPLLGISHFPGPIPVGDARGLIFTSRHGVEAARRAEVKHDLLCWCVGPATAAAAAAAGWAVRATEPDADALVERLSRVQPRDPLLHICGQHRRGNIAARLRSAGITAREHAAYDQPAQAFTEEAAAALAGSLPVVAPVFSPRTARHFAQARNVTAPLWLAAISRDTAKALESLPAQALTVASSPNGAAMIGEVGRLFTRATRVEGRPGAN